MLARLSHLLVAACAAGLLLSTTPIAEGAAKPFKVTSSLDGRSSLPLRIRWIAHPKIAVSDVLEVDFLIDGKVRWSETDAPFVYGGHEDGGRWPGYLITTFLRPGAHRFAVRVTDSNGRVGTDHMTARVAASPEPPAALQGIWTRTVSNDDIAKSDAQYGGRPPIGTWRLVFDSVGVWELDSAGSGTVEQYTLKDSTLSVFAPIQQDPIVEDHSATSRYGAHNIFGNLCSWAGPFGSYTWAVSGSTLTLTAASELCGQRRAVLEGSWTKTA